MCQRRPADPTDPGDAADLSIMGYFSDRAGQSTLVPASSSVYAKQICSRTYENQPFLNHGSRIAWIKVNS